MLMITQYGLIPLLNKRKSECLNADEDHPYTDALIPGPLQYLQSDEDEQLIVFLTFRRPINLHSIQISGPLDGRSPKTVYLFINQVVASIRLIYIFLSSAKVHNNGTDWCIIY